MNMNSITTPVYTAEKVLVDDDNSTYFQKKKVGKKQLIIFK